MGFTSFVAYIDPDPQVFFPGQVVSGRVCASVNKPFSCRGKFQILHGRSTGCNLILIICYLEQKKKGTNCILDNI